MNRVKKLVEQLTNTHIYHVLPRGVDVIHDISNSLPTYRVDVVFDVGANVGQSSKIYLSGFPDARIYCFEPVGNTFRQLQANLQGNRRVDCYQLALGASKGQGEMALQDGSKMSFLLGQSSAALMNNDATTESVDVVTLDQFCDAHGIRQINYLKIDTEGADLEVLKGAVSMLTEQKVDFVEVEAGMNSSNKRHVPFETLKESLESYGYCLFGIYEQVSEWPSREPHLRRTNSVFMSRRIIETNRKPFRASNE